MRYAVALILIAAATGAAAQVTTSAGFPVHDVDAACAAFADRTARAGNTSRNVAMNICLHEEQEGYDTARLLWDQVSPPRRQECSAHADSLGAPNYYRGLGYCLEAKAAVEANERQGQGMREKPQGFRY
ncbi:hypothetical protein [Methylobacterium sp. SI9]|uniref:hypothetical protein n=1 Tax=Methylobacterium guangdongense TaxID=3138811 RepID=UPI00313E4EB5